MRMKILAVAAFAGAIGAPLAAQAQGTVGVVGGNTVVVEQDGGLVADQRPAFREYVIEQRVPAYSVPDRIVVGTRAAGNRRDLLRRAADVSALRPIATPS